MKDSVVIDQKNWNILKMLRVSRGFVAFASRTAYLKRLNKILYSPEQARKKALREIKAGNFVLMNPDVSFMGQPEEWRMLSVLDQQMKFEEEALAKSSCSPESIKRSRIS